MSKIRVHELAKKIGVANQDVIAQLSKLGVKVKTPSSGIEAEVAEKVEKAFKTPQKKPAAPAKAPVVQRKRPPVQKKTTEARKRAAGIQKETPVVQAPQPSPPVQAKAEAVKTAEEPEIKSEPEPLIEEVIADDTSIIVDETEISVPDRFKKEIEVEKVEKFKAKPVIVACRSGHRSSGACGILTQNGFADVYNLAGGMVAWEQANLPVEK